MEKEKNKNTAKRSKKQNNYKSKRMLLIAIILVFLIICIIFFAQKNNENNISNTSQNETTQGYVEEIEPGVKINKSTKLNEAKDVNGLLITNIQLTTESGMTTLLADVTNNTGAKTEVQTVDITLLDNNGQELTTVTGIISELEAGATTQLNIAMTSDYINAYDFKVTMN